MKETAPPTLIWFVIVEGILIILEQFSNDDSVIFTRSNIDLNPLTFITDEAWIWFSSYFELR
jgi:hypothetical protein